MSNAASGGAGPGEGGEARKPEPAARPKGALKVTYRPSDDLGDPPFVRWNGVLFRANVPVLLDPAKHYVDDVPLVATKEGENGVIVNVTRRARMSMIQLAKDNHTFEVEGCERAARPGRIKGRVPDTSDQYRQYALIWFRDEETPAAMVRRWESESALRQACQVGDDDIAFLQAFFSARFHQLRKDQELAAA